MTKSKGIKGIGRSLKARISRHYQKLGGVGVRGAASATALEFELGGSGAAARVEKHDAEVAAGIASRTNRRARRKVGAKKTSTASSWTRPTRSSARGLELLVPEIPGVFFLERRHEGPW